LLRTAEDPPRPSGCIYQWIPGKSKTIRGRTPYLSSDRTKANHERPFTTRTQPAWRGRRHMRRDWVSRGALPRLDAYERL